MKRKMVAFLTAVLMLALPLLACAEQTEAHKGYTLDKVVVLSRHNIRSPLTDGGSLLGTLRRTPGTAGLPLPANYP